MAIVTRFAIAIALFAAPIFWRVGAWISAIGDRILPAPPAPLDLESPDPDPPPGWSDLGPVPTAPPTSEAEQASAPPQVLH